VLRLLTTSRGRLPAAELEMRMRYYREKKEPQLRWMLHQARALLEGRQTAAVPSSDAEPLVIDLGCGKGDFTLLLAAAMPQLCVPLEAPPLASPSE